MHLIIEDYSQSVTNPSIMFDSNISVKNHETIQDLLIRNGLPNSEMMLIINGPVAWFQFYYKDDVVYTNYSALAVKIEDFKEYGYELNNIIHLHYKSGGVGGTFLPDLLINFYNEMNNFFAANPMIYDMIKVSLGAITAKALPTIIELIQTNIRSFTTFRKAVHHKESFDYNSFVKAFRLEHANLSLSEKEIKDTINVILLTMGYVYDKKKDKWIKK